MSKVWAVVHPNFGTFGISSVQITDTYFNFIQAVRHPGEMKLSKFQPSEKLFKRYDDKIKIDKYEGPAFNKVLEQGRRADKDR